MKTVKERRMLVPLLACAFFGLAPAASADGTVYAMTNALSNNAINVYHRAADGTLALVQTVPTEGGGSGIQLDPTDSLGSQGSLLLDRNHSHLYAVNTESLAADMPATDSDSGETGDCAQGSITDFLIADDGSLTFVEKIASGGLFPNSLTMDPDRGLLYVLNAGGPGKNPVCRQLPNITGFAVPRRGEGLVRIPRSTRTINPGPSAGSFLNCDAAPGSPFATAEFQCGSNPPAFPRSPGQVGFTPSGSQLIVTVKGTNSIYVYPMNGRRPGPPTITKAQGPNQPTYFGFTFGGAGNLIVTEPFGATPIIPAAPFSAVSSFGVATDGSLKTVSSSVPNGRGTSCWVAVLGSYAYTSNNATSDISLYKIGSDGSLTMMTASAGMATNPNDLAIAVDQDTGAAFLYALASGGGTVGVFKINPDGSLSFVQSAAGLPASAGAQGLAAY